MNWSILLTVLLSNPKHAQLFQHSSWILLKWSEHFYLNRVVPSGPHNDMHDINDIRGTSYSNITYLSPLWIRLQSFSPQFISASLIHVKVLIQTQFWVSFCPFLIHVCGFEESRSPLLFHVRILKCLTTWLLDTDLEGDFLVPATIGQKMSWYVPLACES